MRQAMAPPTARKIAKMMMSRTSALSKGCTSPMETSGPASHTTAARTMAPRMLSPIQSQAITVIESAFLPATKPLP